MQSRLANYLGLGLGEQKEANMATKGLRRAEKLFSKTAFLPLLAVAGVLLLASSGAQADTITYTFTGTVTSVDPSLSGTFNTSQTLSGSFTYESSTPGFLNGSDSSGFSNYPNALTNLVMTVGSYTAAPPFGTDIFSGIQVANNFFGDDRFVLSSRLTGTQFNGSNPLGFISLDDTSQGAFSDTKLTDVGDLTGWTSLPNRSGSWYIAFSVTGGEPNISGLLTSVTQVTPEPGSLVLLGTGLAMVARRLRRRSNKGSASASIGGTQALR
jgi:hypothetical protein